MIFLLLLLLAAPQRLLLVDEVIEIPARDWRAVTISLRQRTAGIACRFFVVDGGEVRVALMSRRAVERLEAGESARPLLDTSHRRGGHFVYSPERPGEYALLIDNRREDQPARVKTTVALEFGPVHAGARELSAARRAAVAAISLSVFGAIVFFAGRRLRAAMEKRNAGG